MASLHDIPLKEYFNPFLRLSRHVIHSTFYGSFFAVTIDININVYIINIALIAHGKEGKTYVYGWLQPFPQNKKRLRLKRVQFGQLL